MGERVARTLRDVIEYCDNQRLKEIFKQRLDEAERLANGLFEREDCAPLPYFTPHGASHCKAVEEYLNQIIWGTEGQPVTLGEYDFVPTPEEAMYLLSAARLHDIGMMYGIFYGEKPADLAGDTPRVMRLRDEHEMRTVRYIQDEWNLFPWPAYEKTLLSVVCKYHRWHHPISTFDPVQIISKHDGRGVRLVVLAALLRLADACHEDQSRAPGQLMTLYVSLGMPENARVHWEKAKLIPAVHFDHANRRITLTGCCPPKFNFGLGEFDLGEIIDVVRQDVEKELRSVQQVLLPYPNTYFGEVKSDIYRPDHLELHEEEQYMALWPYLLDKPSGSTEAAAALAQMLLFPVKEGNKSSNLGKAWQDNTLLAIMNKTQESRPFDFMIRNLCQGVRGILMKCPPDEAKSAEALTGYLQGFLNEINQSCRKIAELAPALIGPNDVLVVHGYCRDIAVFLESVKTKYNNTLYIVDYPEPIGKIQLGPSETERMVTSAHKLKFNEFRLLSLGALPQALGELGGKRPCKVLVGTHGVLKSKDFLCKVGSYILAITAKKIGAQVIAFAEETKFLINGEPEQNVVSREKLFSSEKMCKRHPTMIDTLCLTPEIDLVPKELVDLVLTEKGAFEPDAVPIPAEQLTNAPVKEKKESNPA